jgi:stress response protein YsnF
VFPDPDNGGRGGAAPLLPPEHHTAAEPTEVVIPLVEEILQVGKRAVEAGRVRVSVTTGTAEEIVHQTLRSRRADVERIAYGHEVQDVPQTREEDGVLIIPVVEEILVVEKRLVLKEEIRLRFVDTEDTVEQTVERRVQHATVERMPPQDAGKPAPGMIDQNDINKENAR